MTWMPIPQPQAQPLTSFHEINMLKPYSLMEWY